MNWIKSNWKITYAGISCLAFHLEWFSLSTEPYYVNKPIAKVFDCTFNSVLWPLTALGAFDEKVESNEHDERTC